jgi:hypothetical protein
MGWPVEFEPYYQTLMAMRLKVGTTPGQVTEGTRLTEDGEPRLLDGGGVIGEFRVVDNG